jgi:hypothetical protein
MSAQVPRQYNHAGLSTDGEWQLLTAGLLLLYRTSDWVILKPESE